MSKRDFILSLVVVFLMGALFGMFISCTIYLSNAEAENGITYKCWAMCNPDSEVIIRERPNKKSFEVGAIECGGLMWTDWKEKNGWLHLVDLDNETGEGWIHEGYVVFEEPELINREMEVMDCKRVACRKYIDGKIIKWAKRRSTVFVYVMTSEWAVTDKGYIMSEFLGETYY